MSDTSTRRAPFKEDLAYHEQVVDSGTMEAEKQIKVLYLITKSNFGGAQRYVFDLATGLPGNFEAIVALGGTGARGAKTGTLQERLQAAHVRTIPVKHFMRDMSLLSDVRAFFEIWRIIRAERPSILHVTSSKAGGLGALAGRLAGVRTIIFTSHGLTFDEDWRPRWQRLLIWFFTAATILLSTHTIQLSRDTYARASSIPGARKKVHLIPNGITTPYFLSRDEARARLADGHVTGELWVGTIAEYHPNKNLSVLIEAIKLLHDSGHRAELWLLGTIGDGGEYERLRTLARRLDIESSVHMPGYVQNAAQLLTAFDIFALPSRKEGLPYVLIEAGFAGLPVIASDIPGNTDIIEHEVTGLLIKATGDACAHALETLIDDPKKAQDFGTALAARVRQSFSLDHMLHETVHLYTSSNPTTSLSRLSRRTDRS